MKKVQFVKVRNSLIVDSVLDDGEFRILLYLISLSKDGIVFPSIRTISQKLNKSTTSVTNKLKSLEEKGYLLKENRTLGTGKKTSNQYLINENLFIVKKEFNFKDESKSENFKKLEEISSYKWI